MDYIMRAMIIENLRANPVPKFGGLGSAIWGASLPS